MLRKLVAAAAVAIVAIAVDPAEAQFGPPPVPAGGPPGGFPAGGPPGGFPAGGPPQGFPAGGPPQGFPSGGPPHISAAGPQGLAPRGAAPNGFAPRGAAPKNLAPNGAAGRFARPNAPAGRSASTPTFGRGNVSRGPAGRDAAGARATSTTQSKVGSQSSYGQGSRSGYGEKNSRSGYGENSRSGYGENSRSSYGRYRNEWSEYRRDHYGYDRWAKSRYWRYAYAELVGYALTRSSSSDQDQSNSYGNTYNYGNTYSSGNTYDGGARSYANAGSANSKATAGSAAAVAPQSSATPSASGATPSDSGAPPSDSGATPSDSGDVVCESLQSISSDAAIDAIAKAVQPTGDQVAKLEALKAAVVNVEKALAASCGGPAPLTSVGRLDAAAAGLRAMVQATEAISGPLGDFYASLTDEQKAAFNALGANKQAQPGAAGAPDLAQLCDPQNAVSPFPTVESIVKEVEPDARQQAALAALNDAAGKAHEAILATCPARPPLTPPARLEAVHKQLQAMLNGVEQVRPALQAFYGSLSDERKARFDALTEPPPPSQPNTKP